MKRTFYASLCYKGIRGGAILVNDDSVIYKNQTLTLPEKYKNITMPIKDIQKVEKGHMFLFPTVTIHLGNQRQYKFIVFNRKKFLASLK